MTQQALTAMLDQQYKLGQTQQQISTGKKYLRAADDPIAASQSLGLEKSLSQNGQYQKNADFADFRLRLEETTLNDATTVLNRVRELAIQGNNAFISNDDRKIIAVELKQRLDELVDLANTKDANDEYIFAGFQSNTKPFALNGTGGVNYSGDEGQRFIQIGETRQIALGDPGFDAFMKIRNGNGTFSVSQDINNTGTGVIDAGTVVDPTAYIVDTYTITFTTSTTYEVRDSGSNLVASGTYVPDGDLNFNGIQTAIKGDPAAGDIFTVAPSSYQDIFSTVNNIITAFETQISGPVDMANLNNDVNRFLTDVDQGLENLYIMRSGVGSRLNAIDSQKQLNETQSININENISNLNDLDYVEAITRLNQQMAGLQAAQQSYVRVNNLSLFNYL